MTKDSYQFGSSAELVEYFRGRADDIDGVVIPPTDVFSHTNAKGTKILAGAAVVKFCDGTSQAISLHDVRLLIKDGLFERLSIPVDGHLRS